MFSLNPITMVKNEVAKLDPDLHKQLLEAEGVLESIGPFLSKLDAGDIQEVLALLPASVKAKVTAEEITAVSTALAALPGKLIEIEAGLKTLAASL